MKRIRPRYSVASILWLMLVVAAFFLGRDSEAIVESLWPHHAPQAPAMMFGVRSDTGVTGQLLVDERNFSILAPALRKPPATEW